MPHRQECLCYPTDRNVCATLQVLVPCLFHRQECLCYLASQTGMSVLPCLTDRNVCVTFVRTDRNVCVTLALLQSSFSSENRVGEFREERVNVILKIDKNLTGIPR